LTLAGINSGNSAASLSGTLNSLPAMAKLNLSYTTSGTNLAPGSSIPVINQAFNAIVPADCIFTITGFDAAKLAGRPALSAGSTPPWLALTWPLPFMNYALETASSAGPAAQWTMVTNAPRPAGQNWQIVLPPPITSQFFRLRQQ
jgi:hypothetical protein